jgi:glycosyltransferase involved in cell wall biosynthesis
MDFGATHSPVPEPGNDGRTTQQPGVLIIAPAFPPVPGDLSAAVEELCIELATRGFPVTIATWESPGRAPPAYSGIRLIPLERNGEINGLPAWLLVIRRLLDSGLFSSCILFAKPTDVLPLALMKAKLPGSTRLIVRLLIDRSDSARAINEPSMRRHLAEILRQSAATLLLTRDGPDRQWADSENIRGIYIPHAVRHHRPGMDFRARNGIPGDAFLILQLGEISIDKNQLGLIQALSGVPADWRIAFASPTTAGDPASLVERQFAAELSGRKNILFVPGLAPEGLAAALSSCDILVCASQTEYAPREIAAAMSHGTPWIATTECCWAADLAGGLRVRLADFRETLSSLRSRPDLRARLGEAGQLHWKQCFTWDTAMAAWTELLNSGMTTVTFAIPSDIRERMRELNREIAEAAHNDRQSFVASFPPKEEGLSFCIITDGQEPDKLRREIESIRAQGAAACEILLGGAVPEGFNDVRCIPMAEAARNGRLGYMRNRLVEQTRYSVIVVTDDDMIFHPGFSKGIMEYPGDYDVLCVRILNIDGTRFWDWAVYGSPSGHHLIDYAASDPFVYVTGGMCVMKSYVPRFARWSDSLGFYQFEDIEYSRKINAQGLRIRFCKESAVTHNDDRYSGNNYIVINKDALHSAVPAQGKSAC